MWCEEMRATMCCGTGGCPASFLPIRSSGPPSRPCGRRPSRCRLSAMCSTAGWAPTRSATKVAAAAWPSTSHATPTPAHRVRKTHCAGWRWRSEATATTGSSGTTRRTPYGAVPVATSSSGAAAMTSSRARKDQTAQVAATATTSSSRLNADVVRNRQRVSCGPGQDLASSLFLNDFAEDDCETVSVGIVHELQPLLPPVSLARPPLASYTTHPVDCEAPSCRLRLEVRLARSPSRHHATRGTPAQPDRSNDSQPRRHHPHRPSIRPRQPSPAPLSSIAHPHPAQHQAGRPQNRSRGRIPHPPAGTLLTVRQASTANKTNQRGARRQDTLPAVASASCVKAPGERGDRPRLLLWTKSSSVRKTSHELRSAPPLGWGSTSTVTSTASVCRAAAKKR